MLFQLLWLILPPSLPYPQLFGIAVIVAFLDFPAIREWFFAGGGVLNDVEANNAEDVIRVSMKGRKDNEYVLAVYDRGHERVIKRSSIRGERVSCDVKKHHEDYEVIEY